MEIILASFATGMAEEGDELGVDNQSCAKLFPIRLSRPSMRTMLEIEVVCVGLRGPEQVSIYLE